MIRLERDPSTGRCRRLGPDEFMRLDLADQFAYLAAQLADDRPAGNIARDLGLREWCVRNVARQLAGGRA